jgi:hypothetical protein
VTAERTLINYTTSDGRFHIVCTTAWFWSLDMLTGAVTTLPLSQAPKAVQRAMELQSETTQDRIHNGCSNGNQEDSSSES